MIPTWGQEKRWLTVAILVEAADHIATGGYQLPLDIKDRVIAAYGKRVQVDAVKSDGNGGFDPLYTDEDLIDIAVERLRDKLYAELKLARGES